MNEQPANIDGTLPRLNGGVPPLQQTGLGGEASEATVRQTLEQIQGVLELLPECLLLVDNGGLIQIANERARSIFGYGSHEIVGQKIEVLVADCPRLHGDQWQHTPPVITAGQSGQLIAQRKDGMRFPVEVKLRQMGLTVGGKTLVAYSVRDIGQRIQDELELRKLSLAVEQSPSMVYITNKRGVIQYVNQKFSEVTGYSRKEVIGRKPTLFKSDKVDDAVYSNLWKTILSGVPWSGEFVNKAKDGHEFWVRLLISPIHSETGVATHFIASSEDISAQKRSSEDIAKANFLADTALELTKAGPWHIRLDGAGTYTASERTVSIYGIQPTENYVYRLEEDWFRNIRAVQEDAADELIQILEDASHGQLASINTTFPYKRPCDGRVIWIHAIGRVEQDSSGMAAQLYGVSQDISEIKQAELGMSNAMLAMTKAVEATENANQAKRLFLATMSHEIRTPMNAIINMTQMALDTPLSQQQNKYLSIVNISAQNLLSLINDILDFSKIEAGKIELETIPFSLPGLLDEIADLFRGKVQEKGVEFVLHLAADVPEEVLGDPHRLRQILINIISNAFKFTDEGEVVLRITCDRSQADSGRAPGQFTLLFAVQDSGIGIPKEHQEKLFSAFTQVDSSTSRKYGGTGLGLAISKRLVEMMGGKLELKSELGRGTTFQFSANFGWVTPKSLFAQMMPSELKGLHVLIVDDHAGSRESLQSLVGQMGMTCEFAEDGLAALRFLRRTQDPGTSARPFNLILLDWVMPQMDGLQLAAEIAADVTLAGVPIVMVSAMAAEHEEARALALGIKAFIHKPVTASKLLESVAGIFLTTPILPSRKALPQKERLPNHDRLRGLRILMAEDNPANQVVVEELLRSSGVQLDVAGNGVEALEKLAHRTDYAGVLMDLNMPVMDGFTATREIRARWPERHLPIIALTANAMKREAERCREVGMDAFITKPIERAKFFAVLHQWLSPVSETEVSGTGSERPSAEVLAACFNDLDIPVIQGIDIEDALLRLGLPWEAFLRILSQFARSHPPIVLELQAAIRERDWEVAYRHAHTIAGGAGNISAHDLYTRAKRLEEAAKNQDPNVESLFEAIQGDVAFLCEAIQKVLSETEVQRILPLCDTNPEALRQYLWELLEALDTGSLLDIQRVIGACRMAGISIEQEARFASLVRLSEDYAFTEAAELVQELLRES